MIKTLFLQGYFCFLIKIIMKTREDEFKNKAIIKKNWLIFWDLEFLKL